MEMMGGMMGAAGSIAGAFIAADAQKYSANTNWAIALMNYYARERERTQAKYEAQRVEMKQDLGMTDIEGTTTKFEPGRGWVTTPTTGKKALMGREQKEQMQRLGVDAQLRRQQLERNASRQIAEGTKADRLFKELNRRTTPSAAEIENTLYAAGATGMQEGFDQASSIAARQQGRTNTSNDNLMTEIGKARAKELSGLKTQSKLQAMQMAPQLANEEQKMRANLYNLFATRASAQPDISFSPTPIDSGATQQAMRGGGATGELALKAAMMEGGRLPYIPPNYGMANAVGATGTALQGAMKNQQGYGNLFTSGGGNLWGDSKDIYRGNVGVL